MHYLLYSVYLYDVTISFNYSYPSPTPCCYYYCYCYCFCCCNCCYKHYCNFIVVPTLAFVLLRSFRSEFTAKRETRASPCGSNVGYLANCNMSGHHLCMVSPLKKCNQQWWGQRSASKMTWILDRTWLALMLESNQDLDVDTFVKVPLSQLFPK